MVNTVLSFCFQEFKSNIDLNWLQEMDWVESTQCGCFAYGRAFSKKSKFYTYVLSSEDISLEDFLYIKMKSLYPVRCYQWRDHNDFLNWCEYKWWHSVIALQSMHYYDGSGNNKFMIHKHILEGFSFDPYSMTFAPEDFISEAEGLRTALVMSWMENHYNTSLNLMNKWLHKLEDKLSSNLHFIW